MTIGIFGSKYEYENAIKWKICGEGRKGVVLHICERHEVVNVTEEIIPFEWMEKVLWKIYPFPRDTLGSPPSSYIGLPRGHQRRINAATVSLSHRNPFTFFPPAIRLLFPSPILVENDSSLSLSFSLIELFRSLGEKLLKVISEIIRLFIGIYVLGVSFLGSLRSDGEYQQVEGRWNSGIGIPRWFSKDFTNSISRETRNGESIFSIVSSSIYPEIR